MMEAIYGFEYYKLTRFNTRENSVFSIVVVVLCVYMIRPFSLFFSKRVYFLLLDLETKVRSSSSIYQADKRQLRSVMLYGTPEKSSVDLLLMILQKVGL
jgi:hypothetical protein